MSWNEIASLEAWAALSPAEKGAFAAKLASAAGAEFSPAGLAGPLDLAVIEYAPLKLRLIAIPGGSFEMGVSPREEEALLEAVEWEYEGDARTRIRSAQPSHRVTVAPFLFAQTPLLRSMRDALGEGALDQGVQRPRFSRAPGDVPLMLTGTELARVSKRIGLRPPSEAEWEYVAREGGGSSWIGGELKSPDPDLAVGVAAIARNPGFSSESSKAANRFGVWGLLFGGRVGDAWHDGYRGAPSDARRWGEADPPAIVRSAGAATSWPWQGPLEFLACHAALRDPSWTDADAVGAFFARDLP